MDDSHVITRYLGGANGQLTGQRLLLQTLGGSQMILYFDPDLVSAEQAAVIARGFTDITVFPIP